MELSHLPISNYLDRNVKQKQTKIQTKNKSLKMVCMLLPQDKFVRQMSRIESQDINQHSYEHLILMKVAKPFHSKINKQTKSKKQK